MSETPHERYINEATATDVIDLIESWSDRPDSAHIFDDDATVEKVKRALSDAGRAGGGHDPDGNG